MNTQALPNSIKGYDIIGRIKSGGFGVVYRGKQQSAFGREVAIKFIRPQYANQAEFIRRFEAEAELITRLEHPHIIPLYDYWRDPKGAYLVMRYLRGGSVRDAIDKQAFTPSDTSILLDQVASALDLAHRNKIIHRDIKPGNILLDEDGSAYVADFGIAKDLLKKEGSQTTPESIVGSLDYISPEQARSEPVTAATDIYSMGVTLYEMLTGEHPFAAYSSLERLYKHINDPLPDIISLDDEICDAINDVIQRATAKNPAERYTDILTFAQKFREASNLDVTEPALRIVEQLTLKEHEVLQHLVDGLSNRQIADNMFVTVSAVRYHLKNIYKKLGVRTRVQAIIRARELELIATNEDDIRVSPSGVHSSVILAEPENPYKGLHAFQIADAEDFFGRDEIVNRLLERMQDAHPFQRFLAIVGPSGSGKSSLVKAGLIPALWRGGDNGIAGSERWYVVDVTPGSQPLDQLEVALTRVANEHADNIYQHLQRDERGIKRVADLILPADDTELLVYIDQFEELFTQCEDEQTRLMFLNLLQYAVSAKDSRVRVVITLRADYYDKPLHYQAFGDMMRSRIETLLPLSAKGLERAIVGPAERVGVRYEKGLVSHIVSEMTYHASALPLLQYALMELFEHREGRLITHQAYKTIGGAVGALAQQAETFYQSLDATGRELTRQIFLRLVNPGDTDAATRRYVMLSDMLSISDKNEDLLSEIIDALVDKRLLGVDTDIETRQPTIALAHEAILREWKRLTVWLEDSQHDIQQELRLMQAATLWQKANRDPSYLLTGMRLRAFEQWAGSTDMRLNATCRAYLDTSVYIRDEREHTELRRERMLRYMGYGLVAVLSIAVLITGSLSLYALDREQDAISANSTSVFNAQQSRQLAQVNGVYAALAQEQEELAITLGLYANLEPTPHPMALQALADAAYPPGLIDIISPDFNGSQYFNSSNLTVTRDGNYLIHPFGANLLEGGQAHGVSIYNIDRDSPDFGTLVRQDLNYDGLVLTLALLPDESAFIVFEMYGRATIRDFETFEILYTFEEMVGVGNSKPTYYYPHPSGQRAITHDDGNGVYVWDIDLDSPTLGDAIGHYENVNTAPTMQVAYNHAGTRIATASMDTTIAILNADTGEVIQRLEGHNRPTMLGFFSPDDTRLISAGFDGTLILWDVDEDSPDFGTVVHRFTGHSNLVLQVAFGPDGKTLFTSGWDGRVLLWNIDENMRVSDSGIQAGEQGFGTLLVEFDVNHNNGVALSPDGRTGFTANVGLFAWDLYAGNVISTYSWRDAGLGAAYSPDGRLAALGTHQDVLLLDAITGETVHTIEAHEHLIMSVAFNADSKRLASAGDDGRTVIWDVDPQSETFGEVLQIMDSLPRVSTEVMFSPDNQYLYGILLVSGYVAQWDVASGDLLRIYPINSPQFLRAASLHPDGTRMALAYRDDTDIPAQTILLYDLRSGTVIQQLSGVHEGAIRDLNFSATGDVLLSLSDEGRVVVWETETGDVQQQFMTDAGLSSGVFHPNNQSIYIGTDAGSILRLDRQTGAVSGSLAGHVTNIFALDIHPLGMSLLSNADNNATLWRLDTRANLVNWTVARRPLQDLSCATRSTYQITPLCDDAGTVPEATQIVLPTEVPLSPIILLPEPSVFTLPTLSDTAQQIEPGTFTSHVSAGAFDTYVYEGEAGEILTIQVIADEPAAPDYMASLSATADIVSLGFDPMVYITAPDGRVLTAVRSPDVTIINYVLLPGSRNALDENGNPTMSVDFSLTLPTTGTYFVRVGGWGLMTGGAYTLTVE